MSSDAGPVHRDSVAYWEAVTSVRHERHPTPTVEVYDGYVDRLGIEHGDPLLDVGVGFGRMVPSYLSRGARVTGIDISEEMVESARQRFAGRDVRIERAQAHATGFADGAFRHVVCWAVFDELDQGEVLVEVSRVLARGGRFLVTGKNSLYERDDEEAFLAEEAARAKNHPNHFTHVSEIDFGGFGLTLEYARYFARRGDFALERGTESCPERFYEYVLVLRKEGEARYRSGAAPAVADPHSRSWRERQRGRE